MKLAGKKPQVPANRHGSGSACLLEHDDAADEGDPEAGAPGGGEGEDVDQPRGRRGAGAAEGQRVGREEDPRGKSMGVGREVKKTFFSFFLIDQQRRLETERNNR